MKSRSGFTIVELLIVIVVIAILATITIVAYNGIQARAENSKTTQSVAFWAKALRLYRIDNGDYPAINTCLGAIETYTDSSNGVCWGAPTNTTWQVKPALSTTLSTYIKGSPEPSSRNINSDTDIRRGAMYYYSAVGGEEIRVSIIGITSLADCPRISGLVDAYGLASASNGRSCYYKLP